MKPVWDFGIFE